MKKCYKCKKYSCLNNFHKNRSKKDGLSLYCKECKKIQDKKFKDSQKKLDETKL